MFVCLDLETTGLDARRDHIIEVAITEFDFSGIKREWSSLIRPLVPIPAFTTRLTGIDDKMVENAPLLSELEGKIRDLVGDRPIMGHSISFDVQFLAEKGIVFQNPLMDTCQLAQVLLPNETSYSLEVLGKKLGILHEDAHRAAEDVKANIELFSHLSQHLRALKKEEKKLIQNILEKSSWSWAPVILKTIKEEGGQSILKSKISLEKQMSERHIALKKIVENIQIPYLIEEESHTLQDVIDLALEEKESVALVVPNLRQLPTHKDLGILKDPSQYLDEERYQSYIAKDHLNDIESMFAAKIGLWLLQTETGEKSEVRLIREEGNEWYSIACSGDEEPRSFFKKAYEQGAQKKILALNHAFFLKDQSKHHPLLKLPSAVYVFEASQLATTLEEAWHILLHENRLLEDLLKIKKENHELEEVLDHLASKISILFGLLGIFLQKNGSPLDPRHPLVVEAHHRNTAEWTKVKDSARSIENAFTALGPTLKRSPKQSYFEKCVQCLTQVLQKDSALLWMTKNKEDAPLLHVFPSEPERYFSERVWAKNPRFHLFSHHANFGDDFNFIKHELGLPEDITIQKNHSGQGLPLFYSKKPISNPSLPQNIAEVTHEMSLWLPEIQHGDAFLLVQSSKTAEQFFYSLEENCKKNSRCLFVQNLGGGMGKIFMMSEGSKGKNVFVGDSDFLEFLLENKCDIYFLAFHRLPFSHPNDPISKLRSSRYENAYDDYILPLAALRFHRTLDCFLGNEWKDKKILMLDPRFRDYEEVFLPKN